MVKALVHKSSSQVIHCHVYSLTVARYFSISVVCASNDGTERRRLWSDLCDVYSYIPSIPWIVMEDFNVTHSMKERSDYYSGMPIARSVQEFQQCVEYIGLTDIKSQGLLFTWSNRRGNGYLAKILIG